VIAFSKVAATEEKLRFSRSFPFLTIAYTSRAVIFGHVLATWKLIEFKVLRCQIGISKAKNQILRRILPRAFPCWPRTLLVFKTTYAGIDNSEDPRHLMYHDSVGDYPDSVTGLYLSDWFAARKRASALGNDFNFLASCRVNLLRSFETILRLRVVG
jgi:hypothetical protein